MATIAAMDEPIDICVLLRSNSSSIWSQLEGSRQIMVGDQTNVQVRVRCYQEPDKFFKDSDSASSRTSKCIVFVGDETLSEPMALMESIKQRLPDATIVFLRHAGLDQGKRQRVDIAQEVLTYVCDHSLAGFNQAIAHACGAMVKSKSLAAPKPAPQRVGVGIGVVVFKPETGEVLLGLRKGSHGAQTWALPGGWLEQGESFLDCALRELEEETGLAKKDVGSPSVIDVASSNNIMPKVHSVSVFVQVPLLSKQEPVLMEPDKCERWEWFPTRPETRWPENFFPSAHYLFIEKGHLLQFK